MNEILQNEIEKNQIPSDRNPFIEWVLAIQQDNVDRANLIQSSLVTLFPDVPSTGGVFNTRKGSYEGIYTDADPEVGQWRRISDNSIYAVGSAIPTTL